MSEGNGTAARQSTDFQIGASRVLASLEKAIRLACRIMGDAVVINWLYRTAETMRAGVNADLVEAGMPALPDPNAASREELIKATVTETYLREQFEAIKALKGSETAAAPALAAKALKAVYHVDTATIRADDHGGDLVGKSLSSTSPAGQSSKH